MSLNWKEIDAVLGELDLEGAQIQRVTQSTYDTLCLGVYGRAGVQNILIVIRPGVCRLHATRCAVPKSEKPLRFAELLRARVTNARIEEAAQLDGDRIVRFTLRRAGERLLLYARLWSNAANILLCDENGVIIDAMRRLPKRGEVKGGEFKRGESSPPPDYAVRELSGDGSFNDKIDAWYAEHGAALSLESLRAQAEKHFAGGAARLEAAIERLTAKEADFTAAGRLKECGDIILANLHAAAGGAWLDAVDFYHDNAPVRIKLDPQKSAQENAAAYFEQYRKAKNGLERVRADIEASRAELERLKSARAAFLAEENPLRLHKMITARARSTAAGGRVGGKSRPGLSFKRGDWLILVGRSAAENDELLRRHVKGNDLWLHTRDVPGAYVFIKARAGKSVPLDILLDAGSLALFYSKARNAGKGDLFYTHVKYLRRAKNGPRGLVLPTQEKNLAVTLDEGRLRELERCALR